jgi:hypothetical protein
MAKSIITFVLILLSFVACSKSATSVNFDDKQIVDLMTSGFKQGFELDGSTIYYWPIEIRITEKGKITKNMELPVKVYMKGTRITTKDSVKNPLTSPPVNGQITEGTDTFYVSRNNSGKMKITFADKSQSLLAEQK